ncbi:MAG: hypothetical protein NVSMB63_05150 [Sediminibacterium sp.]
MCDQWSGIVINDYQAVMPVPWREKWGIRYGYVPPFIQQLGITGQLPEQSTAEEILASLHRFIAYGDIHFNYSNGSVSNLVNCQSRSNFIIDLSKNYEAVRQHYKQDLVKNTRKANKAVLYYKKEISYHEIIWQYHQYYQKRMPHVFTGDYEKFERLCNFLAQKNQCFTRSVTDNANKVLASILLLTDRKHLYNLMNTTSPEGRYSEANHWLLDQVLREFSGHPLLFDFEGSELPGVKNFYQKFGPINQPYFHYHYNKLPWPLSNF